MTTLSIQRLTDESSNEYRIFSQDQAISYTFDYATRVANGDSPERLALYSNDVSNGTVAIEK